MAYQPNEPALQLFLTCYNTGPATVQVSPAAQTPQTTQRATEGGHTVVAKLSSASLREKLGGHGYEKEDLTDKPPGQFSPPLEKAHKNEVKASHCA